MYMYCRIVLVEKIELGNRESDGLHVAFVWGSINPLLNSVKETLFRPRGSKKCHFGVFGSWTPRRYMMMGPGCGGNEGEKWQEPPTSFRRNNWSETPRRW